MGKSKYRQLTAQFKPKAGVTPAREPRDDPLIHEYGSGGRQDVDIQKGLLTYTLKIDFSDADKAIGKLWKALDKMHVLDEWEGLNVFGIRTKDKGQCDYFTVPMPANTRAS
jgi:hypothetical protein